MKDNMTKPQAEKKIKKFRYICTTHRDRVQYVHKWAKDNNLVDSGYWLVDRVPTKLYRTSPAHRGRCEVCGDKTEDAFSNVARLGPETNQNEGGVVYDVT